MVSWLHEFLTTHAWQLARIFVCFFSALFALLLLMTGSLAQALLFSGLIALPVSIMVWFVINKLSGGTVNFLYGMADQKQNRDKIRDAEIMKLMPLKEKKQYTELLARLENVEQSYGQSPRLIYYRAIALIELEQYRKARKSLSAFLHDHGKEEYPDDEFSDSAYIYTKKIYRQWKRNNKGSRKTRRPLFSPC